MRRKTLVTIIFSVIALTAISSIIFVKISQAGDSATLGQDVSSISAVSSDSITGEDINNNDFTYIPPTLENSAGNDLDAMAELGSDELDEPFTPATEMDLEPTSLTLFVNKEYALPKSYKPSDLVQVKVIFNLVTYDERTYMRAEAAEALEKLFAAANSDGYILYGISGYRSYERQYKIFTNNIVNKGKDYTLRYSAAPGTSEHQTGLAMDVSAESLDFRLSDDFASSKEGIWLAKHAHLYGYIIRYPEGKAAITGYAYEPWHIRYVGKALANYLYNNELTLDEYYKYTPSKDFDYEAKYADLINYTPPKNATPIPVEGEGVVLGENGEIIDGAATDAATEEDKEPIDGKEDASSEDTVTSIPVEPTEIPEEDTTSPDDSQSEEDGADTDNGTGDEPGTEDTVITPVPTPTPAVQDSSEGQEEITPTPTVAASDQAS